MISGDSGQLGGAERLPAGRHGLPREAVRQNQRGRILAGFAQAVVEHGYSSTTITLISEAASISRNTFYEQFENKEDCFIAAFDTVATHVRQEMSEAAERGSTWPERAAAATAAAVAFFAKAPELARLCLVESVAAGAPVNSKLGESIELCAEELRAKRPRATGKMQTPEATEEVLVSGAVTLLARRLNEGREEQLLELVPEIVEMILGPYVGGNDARRLATSQLVA
jgi:AcrR family transcriptional regulator